MFTHNLRLQSVGQSQYLSFSTFQKDFAKLSSRKLVVIVYFWNGYIVGP